MIEELKTGSPEIIEIQPEHFASISKPRIKLTEEGYLIPKPKERRSKKIAKEELYKKQVEEISNLLGIPAQRPQGMTWEKYYNDLVLKNMDKLTKYYQE